MPNKDGKIKAGTGPAPAGMDVNALASKLAAKGLPPVDKWNPPFCGDLDMRIARDGTWFYLGSPIGRQRLVRLFSTVLRHDADGKYYLVTPVEKIGISVDDAPFVAVEMVVEGTGADQVLRFRTNVGDWVTVDADHPLRVVIDAETGEPSPYILVRGRLEALIARAVFYDLVALGVERGAGDAYVFGVWSSGCFFPLGDPRESD